MSPPRYAPVPTRNTEEPDTELAQAFELSDDEDDGDHNASQNTPLLRDEQAPPRTARTARIPGQYDFEADHFEFQPPAGEPPDPRLARPNSFGNTNGQLPTDPVVPTGPSRSWFRRTVASILPTHREPAGPVGAGQDAVFSMMQAKPVTRRPVTRSTVVEHVHQMPEEAQADAPPSYAAAQADPLPPYWETTILTSGGDSLMVDSLPAGSLFTFMWSFALSAALQWVGFLIAYMLQTSHAGMYGSRAGLGVTFIQMGFYFRARAAVLHAQAPHSPMPWPMEDDPEPAYITPGKLFNMTAIDVGYDSTSIKGVTYTREVAAMHEYLGYMMMAVGWTLFVFSVFGFWRVKRFERGIRSSATPAAPAATTEEEQVRQDMEDVGVVFDYRLESEGRTPRTGRTDSSMTGTPRTSREREEDEILRRRLHDAGLV